MSDLYRASLRHDQAATDARETWLLWLYELQRERATDHDLDVAYAAAQGTHAAYQDRARELTEALAS